MPECLLQSIESVCREPEANPVDTDLLVVRGTPNRTVYFRNTVEFEYQGHGVKVKVAK